MHTPLDRDDEVLEAAKRLARQLGSDGGRGAVRTRPSGSDPCTRRVDARRCRRRRLRACRASRWLGLRTSRSIGRVNRRRTEKCARYSTSMC